MTSTACRSPAHPANGPPALLLPFPPPGRQTVQSRAIPREGILLGRGVRVFDDPFADPGMSSRHAEVHLEGAQAMVHDLGTSAGTRLNGAAVRGVHALAEGDVLRVGDTVLLYTSLERAPAGREVRIATEPELTGIRARAGVSSVRA